MDPLILLHPCLPNPGPRPQVPHHPTFFFSQEADAQWSAHWSLGRWQVPLPLLTCPSQLLPLCLSPRAVWQQHLLLEGLAVTGSHPLRTRHGLCTYVQTESILVCTPKTIMSQPPLDSAKASGEASKADQPLSCLWMSTFQAAEGTQHLDLFAAQLQPLTPELPHQLATSTCS